ncbi:hypothetical protein BC833DRAFT_610253 [Globomyces pollinis-pini]|nr:hypothetical protein BC833DRAFT_610253 [Globomyces pollinis-pini]
MISPGSQHGIFKDPEMTELKRFWNTTNLEVTKSKGIVNRNVPFFRLLDQVVQPSSIKGL